MKLHRKMSEHPIDGHDDMEKRKDDALALHRSKCIYLVPKDPAHLDLSFFVDVFGHLAFPTEHLDHADDAESYQKNRSVVKSTMK